MYNRVEEEDNNDSVITAIEEYFTLDDNYPLDFWVENEKLYVTLAHIAQDILIMPASSTRFFPKVEYASNDRKIVASSPVIFQEIMDKISMDYCM